MNCKYPQTPEVIGEVRFIDGAGEEELRGQRVVGITVMLEKDKPQGIAQLDVRDLSKSENMILEIELSELIAALSLATLNAERP